ncbi:putative C14G10.02-like protein [Cladobotryum mycophilum]|uniref:C14G10.02-like protein n=1 Tax=Cladobotryum mycophilum TaxID=491253 RepID=A0ABR0T1I0_9HYPO
MGKRTSIDANGAAAFRKRQKITHDVPTGEDVSSGDELRKLLAFNQDMRQARHGLQSLKRVLDGIVAKDDDRNTKFTILRQYLELVKPRDTSEDAVFLNDIMEMWSFAAQVNDDGVMSSVAVVLALILHITSDTLDLVRYGLGICQTLVQERQLKSVSRNLSAEKAKGFIISPTLRLLREVVCLDGGAYAKRVVRARAFTFASLGRNLEIGHLGDSQEDIKKASVRTNAVRFFLSCLRYLHSDGRKELLLQKELLSHLTFMIKSDPPYLVMEIMDILKTHVLADTKIPRDIKFKAFNTKTLMRFLALYNYSNTTGAGNEDGAVSKKVHQFLIYACTTPGAGILYPSTGLYPKETSEEFSVQTAKQSGQGNDEAAKDDRFRNGIPVFNFVLSEFAAKLRPWSSLKHSELLIAILTAAPELIADYFFNNRSFTFEPKLSMTWIGYSAFLFNTMRIPLPNAFGDKNQILVEALEKLSRAIRMHEEGFRSSDARWTEAARRLIDTFCQRIPDMKEIVRCYKSIPKENGIHKTMTSRLLHLYYEVIPQVALAANFDVSPFFVDVLQSLHEKSNDQQPKSLGIMELENLVSIASYSPGMRWFSKIEIISGQNSFSPFTALLQLLCGSDRTAPLDQLKKVLADVAVENQLVSEGTRLKPLLQALQTIMSEASSKDMDGIWAFIDNCITRCATSPIKYLDLLETYLDDDKNNQRNHNTGDFNLLTVAMAEQLPYFTSSAEKKAKTTVARFLSLYLNALSPFKGRDILASVHGKIHEHLASHSREIASDSDIDMDDAGDEEQKVDSSEEGVGESKLEQTLHIPFSDEEDTSALIKWHAKSVEDLVEDGWIAKLMGLLASSHINIRKEALTNILKMAMKIKESPYEEKEQIWLLLSELAESSKPQVDVGPVPSAFIAFSIHSLDVLRNPLHPLYPKINSFLTRSPIWSLEKLPLAHDILHGEPSEDDKYYTEITWFLSYILDALKTPFDLGTFHKKRWFEKILAVGSNPYLRSNLRVRILRIIYRATCIAGGSTTLITRFGLLSWLDAQRAACKVAEDADVYGGLIQRAWRTCDQARVTAWSKGGVEKLIGNLK